jgi:NAD(P)-dependent dehydrogenase (short-subunit alcohol dehydrogenase family)
MFELNGRVIIITGAGGGIGRATALALAKQGATLILTDIDITSVEETAALADAVQINGEKAVSLRHDVTAKADWDSVFAIAKSRWGRLDALVNNAGIMITTPFLELPIEQLRKQFEINTVGVFLGAQGAAHLMIESARLHQTKPSIVNLSSIYGQIAGPAHVAYSASKGAVRSMTKGIAVELAQYGIRVNSVHPGPVVTDLLRVAVESLAAHGRLAGGEKGLSQVAKGHPMGRSAEANDVAGIIAFLCTDASAFMTGSELTVDGGYSLL